ncbi:MAG: hypothetical protein ACK5O1_07590 [Holosporales bacterium]|jgi:hypothetical protein
MKRGAAVVLASFLFLTPALACEKHRAAAAVEKAPYTLKALSPEVLTPGEQATLRVALGNTDGTPVVADSLVVAHTEKFHLLLISADFKEYHHIHPQPVAGTPGVYEAPFTPNQTAFRLWADITPPGGQAYVPGTMGTLEKKPAIDLKPTGRANSGQISALIETPTFNAGEDAVVRIALRDADGKPLAGAEPYLGALGHLVGFSVDGKRILHAHPVDETYPASGVLSFHVNAPQSGIWKLFLQVQQNGAVHTLPFTVAVARSSVKPVKAKGDQHDHH